MESRAGKLTLVEGDKKGSPGLGDRQTTEIGKQSANRLIKEEVIKNKLMKD